MADETAEVARRYAEALIGAAEQEGAVDAVLDELDEIERDVLKAYPAVRPGAGLGAGLGGREGPHPGRRLRGPGLEPGVPVPPGPQPARAARPARGAWPARPGRSGTGATSASRSRSARPFPLDEGQLQALRDRLARLTGATPILHVSTDPDLIGGLVVQVGDDRYDASVEEPARTASPTTDRRKDA